MSDNKTPRRGFIVCIICIITLLSVSIIGILWQFSLEQNSTYEEVELDVAFISANDGYNKELYAKLDLDNGISLERIREKEIRSNTLEDYDIVIVSNVDLSSTSRSYIQEYLNSSSRHSVIFFIDENTSGKDLQYLNITKTDELKEFEPEDNDLGYGICKPKDDDHELTENVPWNNMPEIKKYTRLEKTDFNRDDAKDSTVILKDYSDDDSDDVFLFHKNLKNGGEILVFTIWFDHESNIKEITNAFPYIGYFFYSCFMWLEEEDIPSYRDWPTSPLPHLIEIGFLALLFGTLSIGSFVLFMLSYRYSKRKPLEGVIAFETEEEKKAKEEAIHKVDELKEESEPIIDPDELSAEMNMLEKLKHGDDKFSFEEIEADLPEHLKGWNAVGIHRQIGGFWVIFFLMLIFILPLGLFFLFIFPAYVFPTPSGQGQYKFVSLFFGALWVFADLGTTQWMTRNFAAYRVKEPEKAIHVAQCFVWFQMLTGAFQILFVGFLGSIGFPDTIYAHLTYVFLWYSIFQFAGFFLVFINILNSLQRIDMAAIGAAVVAPLTLLIQAITIPIFIQWGATNPMIGIALAGAIGASIANFFTQLAMLFGSWLIFRKAFGYSGSSIFRVDFDWTMFKDMLKFGLKYAPAQALVPLVGTIEVVLLSIYLDNYNSWLGYWNVAMTIATVSSILMAFAGTLIPAVAEAKENGKKNLANYDIVAMLKWGNNFSFWMHAGLLAVLVPLIIVITPPEFQSIAILIPLIIIWQICGVYSWLGDAVLAGMNHPLYNSLMWLIEQLSRLGFLFIFIPLLAPNPKIGMFALMFAYIPALILKNIAMWIVIKKKIAPGFKFYPYKTFMAPGFAGIVFYLLCLVILFISGGGLVAVLLIAAFALIAGPFVYFFLSGLFGGWSKNGLEEFKRSVEIMSFGGGVGRGLYKFCRAGAILSPLREKGNIDIYAIARIEAWELTLEKIKIENI